MITTVTLNAAIDKAYFVAKFPLGEVTRVGQMHAFPGGKGINVARVIRQLGGPSLATGFLAGHNGRFISEQLEVQGIRQQFVSIEGESRICLNILNAEDGTSTELLEQGPFVKASDMQAMEQKVRELASQSSIVVFSGSVPQGASTDCYATLCTIAKEQGAKVILDTSGALLVNGIEAIPFAIKPNEHEIEVLLEQQGQSKRSDDLTDKIKRLMDKGIAYVAVSLGKEGALVGCHGSLYRARAPHIEAVNPVGSGDSFVAGMALAIHDKKDPESVIRAAIAAGTANAMSERTGHVEREQYETLLGQVVIEKAFI